MDVIARLGEDQLLRLERQLTLYVSQVVPGTLRDTREVVGEPDKVQVPRREDLRAAAQDLLAAARSGVEIRPQAESRPLIPLYEAAGAKVPPEIRVDHEQNGYDYYVAEIAFAAALPEDQRPLNATFALVLRDDVRDAARRVRPVRLFPGREDVELFKVDLEGAVGLDAGGRVTVPAVAGQLLSFPLMTAEARLKANIVVGPFSFPFRRAKIEVVGEYGQDVRWLYNMRSALWGTNVFKSILVLKVAAEAKELAVGAALELVPYKRRWLTFKDRLPTLKSEPIELGIELARNGRRSNG